MLAALGKTAARALTQRWRSGKAATLITPGPELKRTFAPPSSALIDAYVQHIGGEPRAYRDSIPPHLFSHWALPVASETLRGVPYPLLRVINGGCRMEVRASLPRNEPLQVRGCLAHVDDDGKRALLTTRVITGTASNPDALISEIHAYVPLGNGNGNGNGKGKGRAGADAKKEKPRVPGGAREIAFMQLDHSAGLSFAKLTGDFNPIHWLPPYAKASGFRDVILHGFGTFARCCEGLNRGLFGGDVRKLKSIEVRFTRPLVLPHEAFVFVRDREVYVGDAIEGPAYLSGRFETGDDR
jgi:hypothetical protein